MTLLLLLLVMAPVVAAAPPENSLPERTLDVANKPTAVEEVRWIVGDGRALAPH